MENSSGIKDSAEKVSYQEIHWDFIKAMAQRLNANKDKYPPNNWKKGIDLKEIEDALLRHVFALISPKSSDSEDSLDHLAAIAVNSQIIYYHLTKNNESQNQ